MDKLAGFSESMQFVNSQTELTTAATDVAIALFCILAVAYLWKIRNHNRWKAAVWCWVYGAVGLSSVLGAVVHGFVLTEYSQSALWHLLYLTLGLAVSLFLVGCVFDWLGKAAARRLMPFSIGLGVVSYVLTQMQDGEFAIFLLYEATVMVSALVIYLRIAITGRLAGAAVVSSGIVLNLAAAAAQACGVQIRVILPFDHNGVFHILQLMAIGVLAYGLRAGLRDESHQSG